MSRPYKTGRPYKGGSDKTDSQRDRIREIKRLNRLTVLMHYGGNPPKCACCSIDTYEFLGIDHIYGHQGNDKKLVGEALYRFLLNNNFPKDFQVLCHNCNMAKGFYGKCPHETIKELDKKIEAFKLVISSQKIELDKITQKSTNSVQVSRNLV